MRPRFGVRIFSTVWLVTTISMLGPAASAAHAGASQPHVRHIMLSSALFEPPAIYGHTVAWTTQPKACHPHAVPFVCATPIYLHLADLRSFHPRTIAQLPRGTAYADLQLSRRYLVWQAQPYGAASWGWKVWERDLATGKQRLLGSSTTGGFIAPAYPALSLHGSTLLWIDHDCRSHCTKNGPSTVSLINLSTGSRIVLAREDASCTTLVDPALTDRTVVWTRTQLDIFGCPTSYTVHVFVLNRGTGRILHRTVTPADLVKFTYRLVVADVP